VKQSRNTEPLPNEKGCFLRAPTVRNQEQPGQNPFRLRACQMCAWQQGKRGGHRRSATFDRTGLSETRSNYDCRRCGFCNIAAAKKHQGALAPPGAPWTLRINVHHARLAEAQAGSVKLLISSACAFTTAGSLQGALATPGLQTDATG